MALHSLTVRETKSTGPTGPTGPTGRVTCVAWIAWVASVALTAFLFGCSDEGDPTRSSQQFPNVVLIISDDHGYPDYGFMGSREVETPNLDRLASEGVLFTHAFATSSSCSASLRTLLTGMEPVQWNARMNAARGRGIPEATDSQILLFETLPTMLRERGYVSFKAGKFWENSANQAGFDGGTRDGLIGFQSVSRFGRPSIEEALEFIRTPREEPFFLWFAPMLPHIPFDAGPEYAARYRDRQLSPEQRGYYANVTRFDAKVGELLEALDATGLREHTLVIYLADNGWDPTGTSSVGGDRGKLTAHDLGVRTPMILRLPGATPRSSSDLVSLGDVAPTILDAAGIPKPVRLPGRSLLPFVRGEPTRGRSHLNGWLPHLRHQQDPETGELSELEEGAYSLRTPRWHYFWIPELEVERLYDVAADPLETRDLSTQHPDLARVFHSKIVPWKRELTRRALRNLPSAGPPASSDE
jgi:arylsulfatase A-like enzyme